MIIEEEFSSPIKVMERAGNKLSSVIRSAWDGDKLETLTKNSPLTATGGHISIIAHITEEELHNQFPAVDLWNGFANRFLWFWVKRSKKLPEGGNLHEASMEYVCKKLSDAIKFAREDIWRELKRDDQARDFWRTIYGDLSEPKPGVVGAVLSRAEAQVTRVSCIYALLDKSSVITKDHLEAALALWKYSEASALRIFGKKTGNNLADHLHGLLVAEYPHGLSRSQFYGKLNNHVRGDKLQEALDLLESQGLARYETKQTEGRSSQIWFAVSDAK